MGYFTKSDFLTGNKCVKRMWEEKTVSGSPTYSGQFRIYQGKLITDESRKQFPEGVLVPLFSVDENIKETQQLLKKRVPLFEAGFQYKGFYARCDILVPHGENSWDLIEVKSSKNIKQYEKYKQKYLDDIDFQRFVLEGNGIPINSYSLMYLNKDYTPEREEPLFLIEEVSDYLPLYSEPEMKKFYDFFMMASSPDVPIGKHCEKECVSYESCWKGIPDGNVFELYWDSKRRSEQFYNSGIVLLSDIPDEAKLSAKQCIQVKAAREGLQLDIDNIQEFLNGLTYPLYYMDFETFSTAIPVFDTTKVYQKVPFQWSVHVDRGDQIEHMEFLEQSTNDPRYSFISKLRRVLGDKGSVIVYNAKFERGVLKELAEAFPEFSDWVESLEERYVDLLDVFRGFSFYHPAQRGSASLKYVYPVFDQSGYSELGIQEGEFASFTYLKEFHPESLGEKLASSIDVGVPDLLEYCKKDTEAMVVIIEGLRKLLYD